MKKMSEEAEKIMTERFGLESAKQKNLHTMGLTL